MEWILGAAVIFLLFKVSAMSGITATAGTPVATGLAPMSPTKINNTTACLDNCAAKVAAQLTEITGIQTAYTSTPFDDLPGAGAVTLGGGPATTGYNPSGGMGTDENIALAAGLAKSAVGMVGAAGSALSGGGAAFAATALGAAIPLIGIGVAILGTVVGMIEQHHQIALANEGRILNSTDPNALSAFVLVVQGVIDGEITSVEEVQTYLTTIVNDWYGQVSSIQRGKWPYQITAATVEACDPWVLAGVGANGVQTITPPSGLSSFGNTVAGGETNWFGAAAPGLPAHVGGVQSPMPSTCNAACVVGHYFIERGALIVSMTCAAILAGGHGIMTLPQLPPHDTQSGVPQIQVLY
jgi:hypothetical protein